MPTVYLVTGSREYADLTEVTAWGYGLPEDAYLMDGMARGVDNAAFTGFYRCHPGAQSLRRPAEWDKHGKKAGLLRNEQMVLECVTLQDRGWAVEVHAWWDGSSRGTKNCMDAALAVGFPVTVHRHGQEPEVLRC